MNNAFFLTTLEGHSLKDFYSLTRRGRAARLRELAMCALQHYDLDVTQVRLLTNHYNGIFSRPVMARGGWRFKRMACQKNVNVWCFAGCPVLILATDYRPKIGSFWRGICEIASAWGKIYTAKGRPSAARR